MREATAHHTGSPHDFRSQGLASARGDQGRAGAVLHVAVLHRAVRRADRAAFGGPAQVGGAAAQAGRGSG